MGLADTLPCSRPASYCSHTADGSAWEPDPQAASLEMTAPGGWAQEETRSPGCLVWDVGGLFPLLCSVGLVRTPAFYSTFPMIAFWL